MSVKSVFLKYASAGVVAGTLSAPSMAFDQAATTPASLSLDSTPSYSFTDLTYLARDPRYLYIGNQVAAPDYLIILNDFCADHKKDCGTSDGIATIPYWRYAKILRRVNNYVNNKVHYVSDKKNYGVSDKWVSLPLSHRRLSGDCEDYALTKRDMLSMGIPAKDRVPLNAMMIAYVRMSDGGGHAVLVVRTTEGDMVLDSMAGHKKIMRVNKTGHDFRYVTDPADRAHWRTAMNQGPVADPTFMTLAKNGDILNSLMDQYRFGIVPTDLTGKIFGAGYFGAFNIEGWKGATSKVMDNIPVEIAPNIFWRQNVPALRPDGL